MVKRKTIRKSEFEIYGFSDTKSSAETMVKQLRKKGKQSRVLKRKQGYFVMVKPKKRRRK